MAGSWISAAGLWVWSAISSLLLPAVQNEGQFAQLILVGRSQPTKTSSSQPHACSANGDLVDDACVCDAGWRGKSCHELDTLPVHNDKLGYKNDTTAPWSSWGGSVIKSREDGKWHMFAAQMAKHCSLDAWGSNSEIVHAEADDPEGPFVYKEAVITAFAHNPTVARDPVSGAYVLYMIGKGGRAPGQIKDCTAGGGEVYADSAEPVNNGFLRGGGLRQDSSNFTASIYASWAPSVHGPWSVPAAVVFDDVSEKLGHGRSNPSPVFEEDGSVLLAFVSSPEKKNIFGLYEEYPGVARSTVSMERDASSSPRLRKNPEDGPSPAWLGPFRLLNQKEPVMPPHLWCPAGTGEDPFLWRDARRGALKMLVHGMCPTGMLQAHYAYSTDDGASWTTATGQTYSYSVEFTDKGGSAHQDQERPWQDHHLFSRMERPHLAFNDKGEPVVLYTGVCSGLGCLNLNGGTKQDRSWTLARPLGDRMH
eukprot:TRINITY_DN70176_c0_g1_i1.p1 TRINITY_DN70176_c0_g1~~TRINITY_DN70176_c0_g1_i1.p1  ORF type:complete len:478 (-),score=33.78 TRINITY_DN70176_c0_g1_i1:145-1578(-)